MPGSTFLHIRGYKHNYYIVYDYNLGLIAVDLSFTGSSTNSGFLL